MFVCTLRKGGLRKLAVVAVCGVVLAGAAITVGVVRNKGDAVDAAAQGGALSQQITGAQDVATFLPGVWRRSGPHYRGGEHRHRAAQVGR